MLSFYKTNPCPKVCIVVYTDAVPYLQSYLGDRVQYREIDQEKIDSWKGDIDFVHRVKIKMLQDFISAHSGHILYADTDTMFCADVSELYQNIAVGKRYMHQNEGMIGDEANAIMKKVNRFFQSRAMAERIDISYENIANLCMYNAGVLGFGSEQDQMISKSLTFTDYVYPKFPKHVIEQLAFSLYMQELGPVYEAKKEIFHYWNFKNFGWSSRRSLKI